MLPGRWCADPLLWLDGGGVFLESSAEDGEVFFGWGPKRVLIFVIKLLNKGIVLLMIDGLFTV